jgi:hypothetical protein
MNRRYIGRGVGASIGVLGTLCEEGLVHTDRRMNRRYVF